MSQHDRIVTIPNALSLARLVGIPVFLWLVLVEQADIWAFVV
ncbi:MAG TPA: CDP-alcohol phosphatidyltransferase family protein, partial [Candidatus Nanopelagicales bacterium]|nr:CDP-alcohol phosphatidyltransferase family protein [Candidatus Nanopelagicales bacterium]